jgi:hypothetical protein
MADLSIADLDARLRAEPRTTASFALVADMLAAWPVLVRELRSARTEATNATSVLQTATGQLTAAQAELKVARAELDGLRAALRTKAA